MLNENEIKESEVKLELMRMERNNLNSEMEELSRKQLSLNDRYNDLKSKIKEAKKKPNISEHAIVRYFERVRGINVQEIRDNLLSKKIINQINVLGSGKIPMEDCTLIVKDKCVVSVISKDML